MIEYGLLNVVVKINDMKYALCPIGIVEGMGMSNEFQSTNIYPLLNESVNLESTPYLVSEFYSEDELREIFDYEDDDLEFLKQYYLTTKQDFITIVDNINGKFTMRRISTNYNNSDVEIYNYNDGIPSVSLNETLINRLISLTDKKEARIILERLSNSLKSIKLMNQDQPISRVIVKDNQIAEIDTPCRIIAPNISTSSENVEEMVVDENSISVLGLEKYLGERIIGREEEIRRIATIMISNYTALPHERLETTLVLGASGTGKTATFNAISEYLNVPVRKIDCPNLVPQGIVGNNIQGVLAQIYNEAGGDLAKASKTILVFDEFDKLSAKNPDFKWDIMSELLKFIEGSKYYINTKTASYTIDTTTMSKVFLGVFDYASKSSKAIGFGSITGNDKTNLKLKLADGKHFNEEIISRISDHLLKYDKLTPEQIKQVILTSKYGIYQEKKKRFQRQFGIDFIIDDSYIEALMNSPEFKQESMRLINSLITEDLIEPMHECLEHPTSYRKLILTNNNSSNNKKYILI